MIRLMTAVMVLASVAMADGLQLRDGSSVSGSWIGADAQRVRFLVSDQVATYNRADVQIVTFGDAAPAAPVQALRPAGPPPAMEQIGEGIRFRVEKCERHATESIRCSFTAEALTTDLSFILFVGCSPCSSIVDSHGIQQQPIDGSIGSARGSRATTLLVQNVPVRGELVFGGVDPQVDRVALLTLRYYINNRELTALFRGIPLTGN
jgi:hypothetical protein